MKNFLHDSRVPLTNNEAERLLRGDKKQVQAVSFRSQDSIEYLCQCMSMQIMMRRNEETNIFNRVSQILGKVWYTKRVSEPYKGLLIFCL